MSELKVTIKNLPEDLLNDVWELASECAINEFNEVIVPNNDIVIDFKNCNFLPGVLEIVSRAVSEHCSKTGMKIKGTA